MIQVMDDGCRTSKIALVAGTDQLKYILATENMKAGDIIRTSGHIPRIPGWLVGLLTFKNRAAYMQDRRTATLQMLHFIFFFQQI